MKLGRLAFAAVASVGFAASAFGANGSNFLQLMNGIDFFYGGFYNPVNPPVNVTNGFWRCIPSSVLHAPTVVVNAADPLVGTYAAKIDGLHFTSIASTGATATWPTIAFSSGDSDCRAVVGGFLNFGFASAAAFGGTGLGWFAVGPTSGTQLNLLALIFNANFPGPHTLGATGAIVYGLNFTVAPLFGVSSITVPEGQSVTYWMADDKAEGPGAYQYQTGSENERAICSSLSFFASGVAAVGTALAGAVFGSPTQREWGMFISTVDGALMAATAPTTAIAGSNTTMGAANPMDTGTGGLTVSLTGATPEGGNGLGGVEILSFNGYDQNNAFGGSGRLMFANLASVNALASPSCGPWSAGYFGLPTGGAGGPVLSNSIPQLPRITGQLDVIALNLIGNPVWTLSTIHNMTAAGNEYPMFPGFAALIGGSTGNNGGFGIPIPALPALVGVELFFSGVGLNATNSGIAAVSNNGHSHSNGWATFFFP